MISRAELSTVSWQCIHFLSREDAASIESGNERLLFIASLSAANVSDKETMLKQVRTAFRMPNYVGSNWDAIEDALRDLEWLQAEGYVALVYEADLLWMSHSQLGGRLIEVWLTAAEFWANSNVPFHLVFVGQYSHAVSTVVAH